jgi:hypothetical protein
MSFVMAVPAVLATAATDLANLGSTLTAAAAVPTTAPTTRCRNSVGRNGIPGKSGHRPTRFGTGFLRGLADVCALRDLHTICVSPHGSTITCAGQPPGRAAPPGGA